MYGSLNTSLGSGRAVFFLIGVSGPQTLKTSSRSNASQSKIDCFAVCRETYVCSPVTRADDRGTHAEKKGPLYDVKPLRSAEEEVRLGEGAMGWYRKGKFQRFRFYPPCSLAAYPVPATSRRNEHTRTCRETAWVHRP